MESLAELRDALPGFGFNDYLRHARFVEERSTAGAPLRVAVLRSYTVEPIEPVLKIRLMLDGYLPSCWFGGYNQYVQDVLDPAGRLKQFRPDLILMMIRLEELVPDFVEQFPSRPAAEWSDQLASKARELAGLAEQAARDLSAQVIVQNGSLSRPYFGVYDAQRRDSQVEAMHSYNRALAEAVEELRGVFIWDFDRFVRGRGADNLYDAKAWYVSRNPFRQAAYPAIVDDLYRYVRGAVGRVKKCVVMDLDNTLWGGIAGEDGLEGIELGTTYPGSCYRDFQRELLRLYDRGILLAIDSKNNEADALRIIDEHPDMVLRRHHFAAMRINWQDKASNLKALVQELNIGMDSLIFVDDNPAECELIRQECPECDVVLLPDKPYLLPAVVETLPGIENIRLTVEDRRKGELYRARADRREHEAQFANMDDFLRSLDMEVAINAAAPFSIPRIAQLTQKTNQMNMTTRRYTEAQIAAFAGDPRYGVFSVAARDRFGDHGIIGVVIAEFSDSVCRIDTLLLSCRVIGRGIEALMVAFIAELARRRSILHLVGEFIPTPKNAPAAGFYEAAGFRAAGPNEYRADLLEGSFPPPPHIRLAGSGTAARDSA
jgi:FkbH-like protein